MVLPSDEAILEARIPSVILVEVGVESPSQIYNLLANAKISIFPQKSLS